MRLIREAEDGTVRLRWLLLSGDNARCHDVLAHDGPGEPGEPSQRDTAPLLSQEPLPPPLPLQAPEFDGGGGSGSAQQLVAGAREWRCGDAATLRRLLRAGAARQAAWATSGGESSVVPHAHGVLQLWSDAADAPRITLVDLAASDCVVDSAGSGDSAALRQRVAASSSLASLGALLQRLAAGQHSEARFKELKLTQLLQPWLPPRGDLWLLATVSSAAEQRAEARRTLQFATLVKVAAGGTVRPATDGGGGGAQPALTSTSPQSGLGWLRKLPGSIAGGMVATSQVGVAIFREKVGSATSTPPCTPICANALTLSLALTSTQPPHTSRPCPCRYPSHDTQP